MLILGIESSCDETGVAIYDAEKGLIADQLYSQISLHQEYGGVVPELASRDHIRKIIPLIKEALIEAKIKKEQLDAIAYTAGPGLIGSLLVGATVAKSLSYALNIPAIEVHHMEGHMLAPMLEDKAPTLPFIALLVSGGHTMLVEVQSIGEYNILGESLDDAAGEAFDKTAKLLGLNYPGGPVLSKLATKGTPNRFKFPRPMIDRPGLDFSFSGLKTYASNTIRTYKDRQELDQQTLCDIAYAFEEAVVDTLSIKCKRALQQTNIKTLVIAGGVSANQRLRNKLQEVVKEINSLVFYPQPKFCTDNGAMIAFAGYMRYKYGTKDNLSIKVYPRWDIASLPSI